MPRVEFSGLQELAHPVGDRLPVLADLDKPLALLRAQGLQEGQQRRSDRGLIIAAVVRVLGKERCELLGVRLRLGKLVPDLLADLEVVFPELSPLAAHDLEKTLEGFALIRSEIQLAAQCNQRRCRPDELAVEQAADEEHVEREREGERDLHEPALGARRAPRTLDGPGDGLGSSPQRGELAPGPARKAWPQALHPAPAPTGTKAAE